VSRNPKSLLLVFAQSLLLLYLFLSGPVVPNNLVSGILEVVGVGLGLWSIYAMRITTLQITADVPPDSNLISDGPYKFIRHPMYLGVLLVALGLLINVDTPLRILAFLLLAFDIIIKANYEEMLLIKYFKEGYKDYQQKTKKFIPFVY